MNARQTGEAAEYLRRSVERDKSADKDRGAGQKVANRAQAAIDGVEIVRTFDGDWGTSGGRGKRDKRAAMADLIDAIRAGEVSRVYCHTTDRLARDVEYGMTFWNACKDAGTLIRAGSQTFDPREPGYLTLWTVLLAQAEEDLDRMSRKNGDVSSWRAEHVVTCELPGRPHEGRCHLVGCIDRTHCRYSHRLGHPNYGERPGESVAAVVAAYKAAGSVMGAARALNQSGIATRMGGRWGTTTVREVLIREGAMPHRRRPGAKQRAPFLLYGLLKCHCGHVLTGTRYKNGSDLAYVAYKCHDARGDGTHGRSAVPEKRLLEWAKDEAARLRLPDAVEIETDHQAERDRLEARRARVLDMYERGDLDPAEYGRRIAVVKAEADRLDEREEDLAVVDVPDLDWSWPPERVNAVLRALWDHVELDEAMQPVRAEWRLPAEYVA